MKSGKEATSLPKQRKPYLIALMIWLVGAFLATALIGVVLLLLVSSFEHKTISYIFSRLKLTQLLAIFAYVYAAVAAVHFIPFLVLWNRIKAFSQKEWTKTQKQRATLEWAFGPMFILGVWCISYWAGSTEKLSWENKIEIASVYASIYLSYSVSFLATTYFVIKDYYRDSPSELTEMTPLDYFGEV